MRHKQEAIAQIGFVGVKSVSQNSRGTVGESPDVRQLVQRLRESEPPGQASANCHSRQNSTAVL